jgi:hypothetical protein
MWLWLLGLGAVAAFGGWFLQQIFAERVVLCQDIAMNAAAPVQAVALDCYLDARLWQKVGTILSMSGCVAVITALTAAYRRGRSGA